MSDSRLLDLEKASLLDSDDPVNSRSTLLPSTIPPSSTEAPKNWFGVENVLLWLAITALFLYLCLDQYEQQKGIANEKVSSRVSFGKVELALFLHSFH